MRRPRKRKLPGSVKLHSFCFNRSEGCDSALLPILADNEANSRENRLVSNMRHKSQRMVTRAHLRAAFGSGGVVYGDVKLVRICPPANQFDKGDNVNMSMKYIRDEIARWMHGGPAKDGPNDPTRWSYDQRTSDSYGVYVELRK